MPDNKIPAMPVPGSPADDTPIRLEPAGVEIPAARTIPQPSPGKTSHPQKTPPPWETDLILAARKPRRLIIPSAIILSICLIGALVGWYLQKQAVPAQPAPDIGTSLTPIGWDKWEPEARKVLSDYLDATANGNLTTRIHLVSDNPETKTLMPGYQAPIDPTDVVSASAFVPKSLPKGFYEHGIYLMYYQRPDTLPDDTLFRPIVPMRIGLKLDSPTFLERSASRRYSKPHNRQNVCAFFKRGNDGRITLDWPIFVQTRHHQLSRFVTTQNPSARQIFRMMVTEVEPALKKHIYNHQLPHHDWYRIQCPGYLQDPHIVAVPSQSPAADLLKQVFSHSQNTHPKIQAVTAKLAWLPTTGENPPVLGISQIICLDFLGLNTPIPTR